MPMISRHRSQRKRQPDASLLALEWGSLWGLALGSWITAPLIANAHFIRPATFEHWAVLVGTLAIMFAVMGAVLSLLTSIVLVLGEQVRKRPFRDKAWAYAFAMGPLLVVLYVGDSVVVHWVSYRSGVTDFANEIAIIAGVLTLCALAFRKIYARVADTVRPRRMAILLAVVSVSGFLVLPLRLVARPAAAPEISRLTTLPGHHDRPLLVIGLDSGTWRALDPLIATNATPNLKALADAGISGTVEALWPPYWSGPAWASIVTGLPRDVTGIYEDLAATTPGLPVFQLPLTPSLGLNPFYSIRFISMKEHGVVIPTRLPRSLLNGKPFWELLHEAGVPTAIVRFWFSHPPEGRARFVVSDWMGDDVFEAQIGIRRIARPGLVAPPELASELLEIFSGEWPFDRDGYAELLGGPEPVQRPADAVVDPVDALRRAFDIDRRVFAASEAILRKDPNMSVMAVYFNGFDWVAHAFWPYRFPEDYSEKKKPLPQDAERLGPVLDRYLRYFDRRLEGLLEQYATRPNVLIVSDHGHGPTTVYSGWPGFHAKEGLFLLAGPDVPHRSEHISVSYYDIVPTILHLKGFETPKALHGVSVLMRSSTRNATGAQ